MLGAQFCVIIKRKSLKTRRKWGTGCHCTLNQTSLLIPTRSRPSSQSSASRRRARSEVSRKINFLWRFSSFVYLFSDGCDEGRNGFREDPAGGPRLLCTQAHSVQGVPSRRLAVGLQMHPREARVHSLSVRRVSSENFLDVDQMLDRQSIPPSSYVIRMKDFERERRLMERAKRIEKKQQLAA